MNKIENYNLKDNLKVVKLGALLEARDQVFITPYIYNRSRITRYYEDRMYAALEELGLNISEISQIPTRNLRPLLLEILDDDIQVARKEVMGVLAK